MDLETLIYEKNGPIAVITLNRPEARNSFNSTMVGELGKVWKDVKFDDSLKVAVVTGAGNQAFCAGADVKELESSGSTSEFSTRDEGIRQLTSKHNHCWKPVITAINGMVVGGGFHFVVAGDINIACGEATFFDTHVNIGLVPVFEPIELARKIPWEVVSRLFLLAKGERMTAARAFQVGMVSEVVTRAELMPRAMDLAEIIASQDLRGLMGTVEVLYKSRGLGISDAIVQGLAIRELSGRSIGQTFTQPTSS
ncbi:MAG: enoyl-CoA hydratase/isomerase family protein [Actinomycetota bacterium]|nr:enoyl-CoA hydratase/isomerase family protein [Actinomycetota bacterium]